MQLQRERLLSSNALLPLSVIIPAFNCAEYLEHSVASLFNGPFMYPAEIIIIDDCSTDDTPKVINELIKRFPNVRTLKTPENSGAACARKLGLEQASFDFAGFLDGDDWVSPGAFASALTSMLTTGAELCALSMERVNDAGVPLFKFKVDLKPEQLMSGQEAAHKSLVDWGFYTNGVCLTKKWLDAYSGVPSHLVDSDELVSRKLLLLSTAVTISSSKYFYRKNERSVTESRREFSFDDLVKNQWLVQFGLDNGFTQKDRRLANIHLMLSLRSRWLLLHQAPRLNAPEHQILLDDVASSIEVLSKFSSRGFSAGIKTIFLQAATSARFLLRR